MVYAKWLRGAVLIGGILIAPAAQSTPPAGVVGTTFAIGDFDHQVNLNTDRIKLQTKGATDVVVRKLEFAAGGTSGWHHHEGFVLIVVQSGSVVVSDSNCGSITYGPGSPNGSVYVEADSPHTVTSVSGAVLYLTAIGHPPVVRFEDPLPTCA